MVCTAFPHLSSSSVSNYEGTDDNLRYSANAAIVGSLCGTTVKIDRFFYKLFREESRYPATNRPYRTLWIGKAERLLLPSVRETRVTILVTRTNGIVHKHDGKVQV